MIAILKSTWLHLIVGLRVLFFAPLPTVPLRSLGPEPALIAVLYLACDLGVEIAAGQGVDLWSTLRLTATSVAVLMIALMAFGARRLTGDGCSFLAVVLSMSIWFTLPARVVMATAEASGLSASDGWSAVAVMIAIFVAITTWLAVAMAVFAARSTNRRPVTFGFSAVLALVLSIAVPLAIEYNGVLLASLNGAQDVEENGASNAPIDIEKTFSRQPELIDAQLDALAPTQPGRGQMYFVGMATYSSQNVFKREIDQARTIMDERLGTLGHSIVMINHRDTIDTHPLATLTNLNRVLARLAQRMDAEKDVLVLFITSHGNDGLISVSFPGFSLNDLTPERLAASLERSGIANKVVVLSACHAGSFLPALARPDTLVMAAARADRSSFGCSNERNWTYFGDALFNHGLRETHSMVAAFNRAKTLVSEWETARKLSPPSEPQIGGGEAVTARLDAITSRLSESHRNGEPVLSSAPR